MQFSVGPRLRARVSPTGHFLDLLPPAAPFLPAAEGDVPCPRARVTFGRSPKSDQKRCLKPQVSRLPARLGCAENRGRVPRENQDSADRRTTNRVRSSCRCRSCVPCGGALVYRRGERLPRRSAKCSFIDNKMYNTTEKSPCVADTQGDPVLFLEADHVIGRTAHDAAELFQRDHGDVLVLLQGIQRLVVDAALEKLVLGHAIFAHGIPQWTIIKNGVHHPHLLLFPL